MLADAWRHLYASDVAYTGESVPPGAVASDAEADLAFAEALLEGDPDPPPGGDGKGGDKRGGAGDGDGQPKSPPVDSGEEKKPPCCCKLPQPPKVQKGQTSAGAGGASGQFVLAIESKCVPQDGGDCSLEWLEYGTHDASIEYTAPDGSTKECKTPAGGWHDVKKECPDLPNWKKPVTPNTARFASIDEAFHCPDGPCPDKTWQSGTLDTPQYSSAGGARVALRWGLIRVKDGCDGTVHEFRWFFGVAMGTDGQPLRSPKAVFEAPFPPTTGPKVPQEGTVYKPPPELPPSTGPSEQDKEAERKKWAPPQ